MGDDLSKHAVKLHLLTGCNLVRSVAKMNITLKANLWCCLNVFGKIISLRKDETVISELAQVNLELALLVLVKF